ncbi:Hypothetical protein NTJ_12627 [Nesidiocoris tenuis]|uniref:CABIT domain-containing protein n=1 Tax=Nesidiocoris tenuis TaxID=355587 RepID=A0ABN7B9C7_9HEMI|nr:Hypothetical protein NTJ_12627 [Nesidiocoris tenuis]
MSPKNNSVAVPLRRFLDKTSLPKVVRLVSIDDNGCEQTVIDLILLYKHYTVTRTEADLDGRNIVIPTDYKGWFSLVTERGQIKAVCYPTVQKLVNAQITTFLTLTDIVAYKQNTTRRLDGTKQHYVKTRVPGGQSLKLVAVYKDVNESKNKRMSWPNSQRTEVATHYAECLTDSNQVVYIKLSTTGEFYAVETAVPRDEVRRVYQLEKLLRTFPLPVRVCVIDGNKQQGSMVLEACRTDEVIFACTVDSPPRLLELDVSSLRLLVAPPHKRYSIEEILGSERVLEAFKLCQNRSDEWATEMKLTGQVLKYVKKSPPSSVFDPEYRRVRDSIEEQIYCEISS